MTKGHNQGIMNDKRSQFNSKNDIVNDKKGHNFVNDRFAHKSDSLLVFFFPRHILPLAVFAVLVQGRQGAADVPAVVE